MKLSSPVTPAICIIIFTLLSSTGFTADEEFPELSALTKKFEAAVAAVEKKYTTERRALTLQFLHGWVKHETGLQQAGKLDLYLASKKEREEFTKTEVLQSGGSDRMLELKKIYRHSVSKINDNEEREKNGMKQKYHSALQVLATKLTKDNKIAEAVAAKAIMDNLAKNSSTLDASQQSPAAIATGEINYPQGPNSLGMKFRDVPITGGPTDGKRVLFSIWETRFVDFSPFIAESKQDWKKLPNQKTGNHPARGMNLQQAKDFCQWLTERERTLGYIRERDIYRLPSDHEWSCAVGIGKKEDYRDSPHEKRHAIQEVYPWGRYFPPKKDDGNFNWIPEDGHSLTAPVGSYPANQFGLFDMGGNVREICPDLYPDPDNPSTEYCIVRDVPFAFGNPTQNPVPDKSATFYSSNRSRFEAEKKGDGWSGFRIVLEINGALK